MTEIVPADEIEGIVGRPRHPTQHWGRAVSAEQRVYIMHSQACRDEGLDLRQCAYSRALDRGINGENWTEDVPLQLVILEDDDGPYLTFSGIPQVTALIQQYGQAWRGDWSDCDGRTIRTEMNYLAGLIEQAASGEPIDLAEARREFSLCPNGGGHWTDWCEQNDCPEPEPS